MDKVKQKRQKALNELNIALRECEREKDILEKNYRNEKKDETLDKLFQKRNEIEKIKRCVHSMSMALTDKRFAMMCMYSDVKPCEVIQDIAVKTLKVRKMKATIDEKSLQEMKKTFSPGGFLGHTENSLQKWNIESDNEGAVYTIHLRKDGYWYDSFGHKYVLEEEPRCFYDFNF